MAHPLDGAVARYIAAEGKTPRIELEPEDPDKPEKLAGIGFVVPRRLPAIVSILVGETTYNLRAALDYLIFVLAIKDSGVVQPGTQFPIDEREEVFRSRYNARPGASGVYLRGVNSAHIAQIELLQPYKGCNWARVLRELSNPDKHRHLIRLANPGRMSVRVFKEGHPAGATVSEIQSARSAGKTVENV